MRTSATNPPESSGPLGDSMLDPPSSAVEELLGRAGVAAESPVALDLRSTTSPTLPILEPLDSFEDEDFKPAPKPVKPQRGGRHLAPRKPRSRPAWALAPATLAVVSLVMFVVAFTGNLGADEPSGDAGSGQAAPDLRPAQAGPAEAEPPAAEAPAHEAAEASSGPMTLVVVDSVDGEMLGNVATYTDGVMSSVAGTMHEEVGDGLAQVSVKVKMVNTGPHPVDASTARVELTFAQQSGRATPIQPAEMGTIKPMSEATGEWTFQMPASQLGDIRIALAPTAHHQPVAFSGASA